MTIKGCLLAVLLTLSCWVPSQAQIVQLHASLGDTISSEEAYMYYLFQEDGIRAFEYALVYRTNEQYTVQFYGDSRTAIAIDSSTVAAYGKNIDKINQFLAAEKQDAGVVVIADSLMFKSVDLQLMTGDQKKKMIKDARRYNWKKVNADEKGLMGNERDDYINTSGGAIWGSSTKKKK